MVIQCNDKLIQPYPSFSEDYASVAILIIDDKEILFIKRSENLPTHKGHIAFPGGKKENSDKNIVETALREAEEELFGKFSDCKQQQLIDRRLNTYLR